MILNFLKGEVINVIASTDDTHNFTGLPSARMTRVSVVSATAKDRGQPRSLPQGGVWPARPNWFAHRGATSMVRS